MQRNKGNVQEAYYILETDWDLMQADIWDPPSSEAFYGTKQQ